MPELAVLVGAFQPSLRPWFHPLHSSSLNATKEAISLRSRLFVDHIFKTIVDQRSCLQGQGYL